MAAERTVTARWEEGLRCVTQAGRFDIVVDEPESVGGTDRGPQPTELLLASVASCFTLAVAYSADKRGVAIESLDVAATGTYDGPRFSAIRIAVRVAGPSEKEVARLIRSAERVCYVTNTLQNPPEIEVVAE